MAAHTTPDDCRRLENVWKRWCSKYKELKSKHNVRSHFKTGETGLAGEESIPQSATAAIDEATKEWDRFLLFHDTFGDCARFRDLQSTSLTPMKPSSTPQVPNSTDDTMISHQSKFGTKSRRSSAATSAAELAAALSDSWDSAVDIGSPVDSGEHKFWAQRKKRHEDRILKKQTVAQSSENCNEKDEVTTIMKPSRQSKKDVNIASAVARGKRQLAIDV
jgi:hypothetical protein